MQATDICDAFWFMPVVLLVCKFITWLQLWRHNFCTVFVSTNTLWQSNSIIRKEEEVSLSNQELSLSIVQHYVMLIWKCSADYKQASLVWPEDSCLYSKERCLVCFHTIVLGWIVETSFRSSRADLKLSEFMHS